MRVPVYYGGQSTLDNLPLETEAVITTVGGEGALRCRFLDMGLIPKTKVVVKKIAPMGESDREKTSQL